MQTCKLREDLEPFSYRCSGYYCEVQADTRYPYRWTNDYIFEIFIDHHWITAESIDFDFDL